MKQYSFENGARFMIGDNEYIVRKQLDKNIDVENLSYKRSETWDLQELIKLWGNNQLFFRNELDKEENYQPVSDFELLPEDLKKEALERYKVIEPFIKGRLKIQQLEKYLSTLDNKVSRSNFYNWKKLWEEHNDIRYLVPRRDLRGPKTRTSDKESLAVADEVINDYNYSGENITIEAQYYEYLLRIEDENRFREKKDKIKKISNSTFRRRYRDIIDIYKKQKDKLGSVNSDLERNGSTAEVFASRPLERVEIDWTPVDVLLIDPDTLTPKRPWLIYSIDKYTGHPLGFFVSFNDIDTKALKQCLLHTLMPKTYISELYPLVQNEWKAFGRPSTIVLDNAKVNEALDVEDACLQLGIDIQYCAVASGHQKGTIERAFSTLNSKFIHSLRGTTFSNVIEKGEYDSSGKACITMQAFIYMTHIALVDMVANGYSSSRGNTPARLWQDGLNEHPYLKYSLTRTKEELKLILMGGFEIRTITNKGIQLQNINYTSPELMELRQEMITKKKDRLVKVRFDLSDMGEIYIYDEMNKRYIKANAKGLEKRGIFDEFPVHISQLELDSKKKLQNKSEVDKLAIARANRNIKAIEEQERKNLKSLKARAKLSDLESKETKDISSVGINHLQLDEPNNLESISLLSLETNYEKSKKVRKKKKAKVEEIDSVEVESYFDDDLDELPDWGVSYKGGAG